MKHSFMLTLSILLLLINTGMSQVLTFQETQDINIVSNYKDNDKIEKYVMKNGSEIKEGTTLKFGAPLLGENGFQHCFMGEQLPGNSLLSAPQPLKKDFMDEEVIVTKITVAHSDRSKNSPLIVIVYVENPNRWPKKRTIVDIEKAIASGEVKNEFAEMSKEEAMAKLKEAKDLLELEIISQSQYDALKEKLSPIILKDKH
jgi:hypothetical protein